MSKLSRYLLLGGVFLLPAAPALGAWPRDPSTNLALCTAPSTQHLARIVPDGSGGAIITWYDYRVGLESDIYAQRVDAKGVVRWAVNGIGICTAGSGQSVPVIAADGAGGAIIAWADIRTLPPDIFAQRVNAAGQALWTVNGVNVSGTPPGFQFSIEIAGDGAGGAAIAWIDTRNGNDDIYAQRIDAAGVPQWTPGGVPICTNPSAQRAPKVAPDGTGGAIVVWGDDRNGFNSDICAQRVNGAGALQWTLDGIELVTGANRIRQRENPAIDADGSGGAMIAWTDDRAGTVDDIYAEHLSSTGAMLWGGGGAIVTTHVGQQHNARIVADGAGGAVVAWGDNRNGFGNRDIFVQRLNAAGLTQWTVGGVGLILSPGNQEFPEMVGDGTGGVIVTCDDRNENNTESQIWAGRVNAAGVPQWSTNGVLLCSAPNSQTYPAIAFDGRDGAIAAWAYDNRAGGADVYAQRIERSGRLGSPEPEIAWVRDVPNEQGGRVRIRWNASYVDTFPTLGVGVYGIWRQVSESVAAASVARGGRWARSGDGAGAAPGTFRLERTGVHTTWWEGVGSIPARGESWYTFVAETFQDSTAAGNPYTVFMIDAHHAQESVFWSSVSDSGYSVDNLPPAMPAPFTGSRSSGATHLHWGPNQENDLAGYRLYRGGSLDFVPGPGNLISAQPDTGYTDVGSGGWYYKLSAVDVHGNQSPYAILTPEGTIGVPPGVPRDIALALASSNPARAEVRLRFALPRAQQARLTVHDLAGRSVATLADGVLEAGEHEVRWNRRDAAGRSAPGGVYFARLVAGSRKLVVRIALTP